MIGNWQSRLSYLILKTELEVQDLPVNLDEITLLKDSSVFRIAEQKFMPSFIEPNLVQGVEFSMSKDSFVITRTGYTVLDILSDVGGLQGILLTVMPIFLNMLRQ